MIGTCEVASSTADEAAAFESLFRYFHPRLVRFLAKLLDGSSIDPEDVAQESMVKAWRKRDQYDDRFQYSTWVYTIARRTAADHLRKRSSNPAESFDEFDQLPSREVNADALLDCEESSRDLWSTAQNHLTESQYAALWLRYGEELSVKEVACVLSKSTVSTRVLLYRARVALGSAITTEDTGTDSWGGQCHES